MRGVQLILCGKWKRYFHLAFTFNTIVCRVPNKNDIWKVWKQNCFKIGGFMYKKASNLFWIWKKALIDRMNTPTFLKKLFSSRKTLKFPLNWITNLLDTLYLDNNSNICSMDSCNFIFAWYYGKIYTNSTMMVMMVNVGERVHTAQKWHNKIENKKKNYVCMCIAHELKSDPPTAALWMYRKKNMYFARKRRVQHAI